MLATASNKLRELSIAIVMMGSVCGLVLFSKFVAQNFDETPRVDNLWLTERHQETAKRILGHKYRGLRIRFWRSGNRTAWILGEIGKEKPITIGIIVDDGQIEKVAILAFRESRGGEVRHPFFTRQFAGLYLKDNLKLSGRIDGITGATLSVRAVSNISRYALFLHNSLENNQLTESDLKPDLNEVAQ